MIIIIIIIIISIVIIIISSSSSSSSSSIVIVIIIIRGGGYRVAVSTLFVTSASTEMLSGTILSVTSPPVPNHTNTCRLAKHTLLYKFITRTK